MPRPIDKKSRKELNGSPDEIFLGFRSVGQKLAITVYGDNIEEDLDEAKLKKKYLDGGSIDVSVLGNDCYVRICSGGTCWWKKVSCG
jgi:hypothetical protein